MVGDDSIDSLARAFKAIFLSSEVVESSLMAPRTTPSVAISRSSALRRSLRRLKASSCFSSRISPCSIMVAMSVVSRDFRIFSLLCSPIGVLL